MALLTVQASAYYLRYWLTDAVIRVNANLRPFQITPSAFSVDAVLFADKMRLYICHFV